MKTRSTEDLINEGVLSFAREPRNNPTSLSFPRYTLSPIEHDYPGKTPAMWNAAYKAFGLAAGNIFLVGSPDKAKDILGAFAADPKYVGGGAGVGFKDEAVKYIDLDPLAKEIGAINFIMKMPDGKLRGYNTDGLGYAMSLEQLFADRGEKILGKKGVVLGAGGTGNAVAFALAGKGMNIVILNRTEGKAEALARKINAFYGRELTRFGGESATEHEIRDADAVINVSTKGASGEMSKYSALAPVRLPATPENIAENRNEAGRLFSLIPKSAIVSDVVLGKEKTPFLTEATILGFKTLDGVPMVVNQGVEAFWMLHGEELQKKGVTKEKLAVVMKEAAGR